MTPASLAMPEIDRAIDAAIARMRARMQPFGGAFAGLGDALAEASRGGKRFRPALVVRSHLSFDGDADDPGLLPVAASFELLHAAFLAHDDLIDNDTERRGQPNISGRVRSWAAGMGADETAAASLADAAALLAGDLLLHEAQRLIATAEIHRAVRERLLGLFDEAVLVSAAGELADVAHAVLDQTPEARRVLAATHDKTAVYSFAAPLRAGAVLAGAGRDAEETLAACGSRIGLAFQLVDDLIGAFGTREQAGKEPGADLREAKHTPLIVLARESTRWPEVRRALDEAHTGPVAIRRAQDALGESGARSELERLIEGEVADAEAIARGGALPEASVALVAQLAALVRARVP